MVSELYLRRNSYDFGDICWVRNHMVLKFCLCLFCGFELRVMWVLRKEYICRISNMYFLRGENSSFEIPARIRGFDLRYESLIAYEVADICKSLNSVIYDFGVIGFAYVAHDFGVLCFGGYE